jgi:hypothetical protein
MTEYYDLSPTHTADPRTAARVRSHPRRFCYAMQSPGPITDLPTLSWSCSLTGRRRDPRNELAGPMS